MPVGAKLPSHHIDGPNSLTKPRGSRKKSRCPGERPTCSFCERLGQPCVYNTPGEVPDAQQQTRRSSDMSETATPRAISANSTSVVCKKSRATRRPRTGQQCRSRSSKPQVRHWPGQRHHHSRERHTTSTDPQDSPLSSPADAGLTETGRRYLLWIHGQPITLFAEDTFLPSLPSRDPELILALEALVLRYPPGSLTSQVARQLEGKARESRRMVMDRVTEGRVELSTLQSLCLLNMFDFASGHVTQSGLDLAIASHLAHSIPPSANPANAQEIAHCLRSIAVLQNLQGCCAIPAAPSSSSSSFSSSSSSYPISASSAIPYCSLPEPPPDDPPSPEKAISAAAADFSVVWRMAQTYAAAAAVAPDAPPPWDSRSDYSRVLQCHHDMDCRAPQRFRFATNRIDRRDPAELRARRRYWMPFLLIQFVHETVPCLLNHPFLLSRRLRHLRHTMPVHFIQQSFESLSRTAGWVVFFLDVLETKALAAPPDPVVAHCVIVVATIHLQHSFVRDPILRGKATTGFDKCMRFLERMGAVWPCVANMANNLRKLQDSIVVKPAPDRDGHTNTQNPSFSIDTRLLGDLLVYDRAGRPDAGRDQSVFGPTLRSDIDDARTAIPTPGDADAAEFDLVGSAGISAHKAVPDSAAVYAPDEEIAAAAAVVPETSASADLGEDARGPSFEDIFFDGAWPLGDPADRFFEANDYGRAIDDWLNLDC
ncbi:C6 transcription factor [Colletotrichum higginsianum IMI 349063]|uniref:C6 transcription factor n=1 Tax=Colletotrichum higginsianum (strain IMI 349063) TaxID=759273 RepID=A0A1B7XXF6_COLHI|nr:C6 transcription factor [Colletotrichum higginsianum IMI 349063]OBR04430.1 C6 transcription factor [Colletotrichum higginsianum IMI 349063]